ncbi:hypothetical protein [Shewanella goraebulensis]|uniref:hypothetical protein n=1 Tax=Shewanella goraebulensis TaxID=3050637 RepID=UPI00254A17A4|nr:hypothetical protein [Shewanella goraebulensis]
MTKRKFSPQSLKDIDGAEYHLHKELDEMEFSGKSDAAELIWGIIEKERLMHLETLQTALKTQSNTQKDIDYYQKLMAHYYHKNKRRVKSSSTTGKLNEHQLKKLAIQIAQLTLEKYPQATAKSLAEKITLYLGELGYKNLPSENTMSKNWIPGIQIDLDIKKDQKLQYNLVIPQNETT